ncbi:MAG TPA: DUF1761 family protein, partial [Thermopetrobacter sp.]|nr:DUF1761 family protein [Thermopetrobacter sp.]
AAAAWFVIGGALYMNPFVARLYEEATASSPAVRKWASPGPMLAGQITGALIQGLLWALVFVYLRPALPQGVLMAGLAFGLILIALKIIPRLIDMWLTTTYPRRLLAVEVVNGGIGGFVMALILAFFLR